MAAAIVDDPPGHLEWPFMADWVRSTTTAYWHSGSQNLNLLIDRYGGSYLTGVGRLRKFNVTAPRYSDRRPLLPGTAIYGC